MVLSLVRAIPCSSFSRQLKCKVNCKTASGLNPSSNVWFMEQHCNPNPFRANRWASTCARGHKSLTFGLRAARHPTWDFRLAEKKPQTSKNATGSPDCSRLALPAGNRAGCKRAAHGDSVHPAVRLTEHADEPVGASQPQSLASGGEA